LVEKDFSPLTLPEILSHLPHIKIQLVVLARAVQTTGLASTKRAGFKKATSVILGC
jgi:hypothetical protein